MIAVEKFTEVPDEIVVFGDWHGNTMGAEISIERAVRGSDSDIFFHLGDFGVWGDPSGRKYLFYVNKVLEKFNKFLFVTLGNHENYDLVEKFEKVPGMDGCLFVPGHENIIFFNRGYSWVWNDKKFMSFGGANSIDRAYRREGKDWWNQEQITDFDVDNGLKVGKVDVMFCHDVPYGSDILGSHRSVKLPYEVELYANESRKQLKRVTDVARPSVLFHGHYHIYRNEVDTYRVDGEYEFYETNTIGLDKELTNENVGVLNVSDLSFRQLKN